MTIFQQTTDSIRRENASDLCAAINAIIIESGVDDLTRPALMAAMDLAAGRNLPFQCKDGWLGRRLPRRSTVSIEHEGDAEERAYAKRWKTLWMLLDDEQARTGHRFVERRRGGLKGEARDQMRKQASTYTVPLVGITVDVIRRAKHHADGKRLRGKLRERLFAQAAREILSEHPQDYKPEGSTQLREKRPATNTASTTDTETTRVLKAQAKLAARAAANAIKRNFTEAETDALRLALIRQIENQFDGLHIGDAKTATFADAACTTLVDDRVLHAESTPFDEPDFFPFEPTEPNAPEWTFETPSEPVFDDPEIWQLAKTASFSTNENGHQNASPLHANALFCDAENELKNDENLTADVFDERRTIEPGEHTKTLAPDLLAQALLYASHGWHVFPLHTPDGAGGCSCRKPDCGSIGKHPRTFKGLKEATTDEAQIRRWWTQFPDANIGIATGKISNLLAIDVDPRHGGWEGLKELFDRVGEPFPETMEVITGSGGRHFLFRMPDADIRNSANKLAQGVDVRGNGGYIVAAPSLHASSNRYGWTTTEAQLKHLPYPFLRELITPERIASHAPRHSNQPNQRWQGGTIGEGSRNETMFRNVACAARARGADYNAIFDALLSANNQCSPPLSNRELSKLADQAAKYPVSRNIRTWETA
jgi:hypothetical protein